MLCRDARDTHGQDAHATSMLRRHTRRVSGFALAIYYWGGVAYTGFAFRHRLWAGALVSLGGLPCHGLSGNEGVD